MPSDPRRARVRRLGLAMAAIMVGYGLVVAAVPLILAGADPTPPWWIDRPIALAGLFTVPAAVAAIGAIRGNRPLLIAAGVLCLLQAFISVVTLGFVVPAIVLLSLGAAPWPGQARPNGIALFAAFLVVVLTLAAWVSLFALTEPRCYVISRAGNGTLVYTEVPATDTMMNGPAQIVGEGSGCGSAELTLLGMGVSAILAIGAIALAVSVPAAGPRLDPV
jgi:hypothetical protein